ncbi:ABC transporter permease [Staphylococcus lugdunensis]|jgi:bacitracin transport system permease protein|nr:ABC transporter permease [Staphylococcus lugdunensis]
MKEVNDLTFKMLVMMTTRQFKAQRHMIIPYMLALSAMFGMEFILLSLGFNDDVRRHHSVLPYFIYIGNAFMSIFIVIFVLYANRFVMRHRQHEFALNMILGMEKKHIRVLLFIEAIYQTFVIALLSIIGGYLFGAISFMLLNKLMKQTTTRLIIYPFDITAMSYMLVVLIGTMILLFIINNVRLTMQSPIELIQAQHKREKPLSKFVTFILLLIGLLTLGLSYYSVLEPKTLLGSFNRIFIAIIYLIISMYCLFLSLMPLILQVLQRYKRLYYQQKYFFTLSGLVVRMRSNAVSLASMTLLCTFLLATLSMCVAAYRGVEDRIDSLMTNQYRVDFLGDMYQSEKIKDTVTRFEQDVRKKAKVDQFKPIVSSMQDVKVNEATIEYNQQKNVYKNGISRFTIAQLSDFNRFTKQQITLKDNEIAIDGMGPLIKKKKLTIAGHTYQVKHVKLNGFGINRIADGYNIIVKNERQFNSIVNLLAKNKQSYHAPATEDVTTSIEFNLLTDNKSQFNHMIPKLEHKYKNATIQRKDEFTNIFYQVNGGLVFIGIVVSIILLIGTFLMMYFKQIAEGYEDREDFRTMQQLGIEDKRIQQTIQQQMRYIFIVPLIVGTFHTLIAYRLIKQLMTGIGIEGWDLFATSYVAVLVVFVGIYGIIYRITSKIYYKMIKI